MRKIILLHGAIGSDQQLIPMANKLTEKGFQTFSLNFSGHGKTSFQNKFDIPQFSSELNSFIQNSDLNSASVFGYSMGGYVALYLAKQEPELLGNIITLGTKFKWTNEIAQKEIQNLDPNTIEQKIPKFAEALKQMHGENWKMLLQRTSQMIIGLGDKNAVQMNDYSKIKNKVLLCLAEKDQMVSAEETEAVYEQLPNADLFTLPNSKHQIESINADTLANIIAKFLEPV